MTIQCPSPAVKTRSGLPKIEILAEGRIWRHKDVSHNLVSGYRATCRAYLKIGDAHAHDSLLDSRAGSHRIGPRRRHYSYNVSPEERTISSCWSSFFYTGRHPDSFHLPQAEYPFPLALTSHPASTRKQISAHHLLAVIKNIISALVKTDRNPTSEYSPIRCRLECTSASRCIGIHCGNLRHQITCRRRYHRRVETHGRRMSSQRT